MTNLELEHAQAMARDSYSHRSLVQPGLHGAFVAEGYGRKPSVEIRSDQLKGIRVAAKDVFDVEGSRTGAGNPVWLEQQAPSRTTALAIRLLLEAGADWVGKTVTDELAYSLVGINAHYGTPTNPASPQRIPGGSSSGSAVAVAAGDADIALGTDCGGSMRLPASFCGVWGMRPTQGRIAQNGCFSLAHSFDTIGWFARDGELLAKAFGLTTHCARREVMPLTYVVANDAVALCDDPVQTAFHRLVAELAAEARLTELPLDHLSLAAWADAHRSLQAAEIWQQHRPWVESHGASLGIDVRQRFQAAALISPADVAAGQIVRVDAMTRLSSLLGGRTVLLMPTAPAGAPLRDASSGTLEAMRVKCQKMLCVAGLSGLPQVSVPWTTVDGAPVGLSVIGSRGTDELALSAALFLDAYIRRKRG